MARYNYKKGLKGVKWGTLFAGALIGAAVVFIVRNAPAGARHLAVSGTGRSVNCPQCRSF